MNAKTRDRIEFDQSGASAMAQDQTEAVERGPMIDLRAIWATIYRNRFVMGLILAGCIALGILSILIMPRVYEARSSVQIDQQIAKVLGTEDDQTMIGGADADRFLQTQVDIVKSRSMAKKVSDSLGLAANDRFLEQMGVGAVLGDKRGKREETVLDTLQRNLDVDLKRNSRVVGILFRSREPVLADRIANSYAENVISGNIQRKYSTSAYSRNFLEKQLGLAKGRLEASERSLIGYARSAQLIDASSGAKQNWEASGPRSLVTANLVQLNESYAAAATARSQARERWEQARGAALMTLPEVLANDGMQRLLQRRAELNADFSQLRQRLTPEHPTVSQVGAQVAELEQQIRGFAESIRNSIRNQYLTTERQYAALAAQVATLKGATLAEQDRSVQYNILQREVDTNRQLYESLLQRFKEVSAEAGIATNNISMVDLAETPRRPISPRPLINLALATLSGLCLALVYAFARERLDDAIRNPEDVESKLHMPLLGVVPEVESSTPVEDLQDSKSEITEAYNSIRTAIELSSNQGLFKSVLVSSSSKGEGKSTTSYALARGFAMVGRKVLLIDADLRRPSLHKFLNVRQSDKGLSTLLARSSTALESILPMGMGMANAFFMPSGPLPPDPANLFAGDAVETLLESLSADYDIIILDGPPVLALADATELTAAVQATIFVCAAGSAHFGQTRAAVTRLDRAHGNLIGAVVTKYNSRKTGYGPYSDYYRYNYDEDPA
ncbi:polysaccharide biosynthesis tyrosine autokinase [Sphingobium sp. AR-3-1]|uniref:non-specific protein-tyrosine kinase n=1 Tax=Sphingobium psychrophilum TaxID=2728834 RepID=A0A7X9WZN2_9SPHN|nr:polysaccharide biosynthesis tyrosine autokinase [Sphingobium psychrophilum]NML12782.1 polysaccharide biosynthesis tyrosine autokinase [Sphingobium psychrophilum]